MTTAVSIVVHRDADVLAHAAAARLITSVVDVQAVRGSASLVLTGGTIGIDLLRAIAESPARSAVEWSALDIWWGDERFLPSGHPDRNETQARQALLDHVPVDPARVRPMPPADDRVTTPEQAAREYADQLAAYEESLADDDACPFDIVLLGLGPDGHVASLFPEHPALQEDARVVGVRNSPKPPPLRVSLSLPTIRTADEVWLVVAGSEKAEVTQLALSGVPEQQVPAAGAHGRWVTRWLLDRGSAQKL